jgi:hypothetical protein
MTIYYILYAAIFLLILWLAISVKKGRHRHRDMQPMPDYECRTCSSALFLSQMNNDRRLKEWAVNAFLEKHLGHELLFKTQQGR